MQKPLGLLSLLDEESTFPNGTDLTFANKLKQHLHSNSCFKGERDKAFTVCHYAGEVLIWPSSYHVIPFFLFIQRACKLPQDTDSSKIHNTMAFKLHSGVSFIM